MKMKMSEEFALPLYSSGSGNIKDRTMSNTLLRLAVFQDFAASEAACHAINNHDRLTSESARLLDMLKRLTSHDNCRKDVIHLMSEADSLIEELEKGDE